MNKRIFGSILLGGVFVLVQPTAMAGGCLSISVDSSHAACVVDSPIYHCIAGSTAFKEKIQFMTGYVSGLNQAGCQGARISIEPLLSSDACGLVLDPIDCKDGNFFPQ